MLKRTPREQFADATLDHRRRFEITASNHDVNTRDIVIDHRGQVIGGDAISSPQGGVRLLAEV